MSFGNFKLSYELSQVSPPFLLVSKIGSLKNFPITEQTANDPSPLQETFSRKASSTFKVVFQVSPPSSLTSMYEFTLPSLYSRPSITHRAVESELTQLTSNNSFRDNDVNVLKFQLIPPSWL